MFLFGLGKLVYGECVYPLVLPQPLTRAVVILIINAIAILSEDRFLARSSFLSPLNIIFSQSSRADMDIVGWGRTQAEPGFGASYDSTSVKAKSVNLIASVRTVMRSMFFLFLFS